MKTSNKKVWIMSMCMLMLAIVLSACSSNKESNNSTGGSTTEPTATDDGNTLNAEEVKLVMYLLGEAPRGMPAVMEELNKKLKEDINATLELNYIGWGDVQSKYPLILASRENADIMFAADWNFYVTEASKGAFKALDEEMIRTYMPKHYAALDPSGWEASKVNGNIYMIPTSTPDRKISVAVIRKDLREKYGVAEVTRFSELGPYFEAISANEPEMIPLNMDSQFDLPNPFQYLMREKIGSPGGPLDSGNPIAVGITYDYDDPSGQLYSMVEEPYLGAMKYAGEMMKDWYDKGYVNRNPYANNVRSKDNFCEGKSGVALGNSIDIASIIEACEAKGFETEIIASVGPNGTVPQNSWLNNGLAVPAASNHPERALQAIDLIMNDPSYVYLTYFGIEGVNYVITEDDKIGLPEGVTSDMNSYPPDSAGFWFVNKDLFKPMATWPESYIKHHSELKDILVPSVYGSFAFNPEEVKNEIANMANVSTQYANPIFVGAVANVDEALNVLTARLEAAGIEKVRTELEQQTSEFLSN